MYFVNELLGIEFNTLSLKTKNILKKLQKQYDKIPATVCHFCPQKMTVEADCCKHFSPPMYLSEFVAILKIVEKWNQEEKLDLLSSCFESFVNHDIVRPCPLLGADNRCKIYQSRPANCRFYGQYSDPEWQKRLKKVSEEWEISIDEIPMKKQCGCPNVDFSRKDAKSLALKEENDIFEEIAELDVEFLEENAIIKNGLTNFERDLVYSGKTYLSFDAQYLLIFIGPDNLEKLADMRAILREKNKQLKAGKIKEEEFLEIENQVESFLSLIKNNIVNI